MVVMYVPGLHLSYGQYPLMPFVIIISTIFQACPRLKDLAHYD